MEQTELLELLGPILQPTKHRRRITDYAAVALLVMVLVAWVFGSWRNGLIPKIESIALVPGSVVVIGPAERISDSGKLAFCPGDTMTVRYQLAIDGEGTIYADDAASNGKQTVKFSQIWRDVVVSGVRPYENVWGIPRQPDMPIDGRREWASGLYTRTISVQASNLYVSRYVAPATFPVEFYIGEDCLNVVRAIVPSESAESKHASYLNDLGDFMELDALVFLVIGLVVGAVAYGFFQGQKLTPIEVAKLAEMAAMSAEQYARDGELRTNDEQLRFALDFMKSRLPFAQRLNTDDMIKMIKSFVPAASALTAQINATKAAGVSTQPDKPPSPTIGNMGD